jgi:uncharacterized protein YidB (DUF937 family)
MGMLDSVISEVGSRFGIGDKARQLVGYLLSYMTGPGVGGLAGFLGKLKNMGLGSILGNASANLTGNQLNSLFGSNVIGDIASRLGLSQDTVTSAAGMAVPAMLTKLAPGGTAPATLPAEVTDLTRQFALPNVGAYAGSAANAAGAAAQSAWSWLIWLLPLIALGLLALYLLRTCQMSTPTTPGTAPRGTEAIRPADPVPPVTINLPDVGKVQDQIRGLFADTTDALGKVTDAASADAAIPKLTELADRLDAAKAMADKLPAAGKEQIRSLAATEMPKLQAILDNMQKIGGAVWEKVKPYIDKLVEKFKALGT